MSKPDDPLHGPVRRYPRMTAEYVVAYRPRDGAPEGEPKLAKTRTVGLGGALFETDEPLERGTEISVQLVVGDRTLDVAAKVVYVERLPSGVWGNGVQFLDISEDDREFLLGCYLEQEYRIIPE